MSKGYEYLPKELKSSISDLVVKPEETYPNSGIDYAGKYLEENGESRDTTVVAWALRLTESVRQEINDAPNVSRAKPAKQRLAQARSWNPDIFEKADAFIAQKDAERDEEEEETTYDSTVTPEATIDDDRRTYLGTTALSELPQGTAELKPEATTAETLMKASQYARRKLLTVGTNLTEANLSVILLQHPEYQAALKELDDANNNIAAYYNRQIN